MNPNPMERLRKLRSELSDMIEDPQNGWGAEVTDQSLDLNNSSADLVFNMPAGVRYEITLKELTNG